MTLPKPYYEEAGITIYYGDCREILPHLPPVDLVLTDPPYGIGFDYGIGYQDSQFDYGKLISWVVSESERLAGRWAIFQAAKNAPHFSEWFGNTWRLIALPKLFTQFQGCRVQFSCDYVIWRPGENEPKWHTELTPRDFFISVETCRTGNQRRPDHPCPRPIDSMVFLVSILAAPREMILDPFMGSGTTLRAAKDLGRKAIGIEIEEKYCEIAVRRLRQEVLPFGKNDLPGLPKNRV